MPLKIELSDKQNIRRPANPFERVSRKDDNRPNDGMSRMNAAIVSLVFASCIAALPLGSEYGIDSLQGDFQG